jgi:hypothetical protein
MAPEHSKSDLLDMRLDQARSSLERGRIPECARTLEEVMEMSERWTIELPERFHLLSSACITTLNQQLQ